MLSRRRTTYDILASILEDISKDSANITQLFYRTGTAYRVLRNSVDAAIHLQLAEERDKRYYITPKGLDFLKTWVKLQTLLKEG